MTRRPAPPIYGNMATQVTETASQNKQSITLTPKGCLCSRRHLTVIFIPYSRNIQAII